MNFLTKMANILDNDGDIDRLVVKCGYNRDLKSIERKYGEVFLADDKLYCMVVGHSCCVCAGTELFHQCMATIKAWHL